MSVDASQKPLSKERGTESEHNGIEKIVVFAIAHKKRGQIYCVSI